MWPREVRQTAQRDAREMWGRNQLNGSDPNPYSTYGRRQDWERGYRREGPSLLMPFPDKDIAYQRGLAYRQLEESICESISM